MRWEYRQPAGKLFVSDGKDIYFYSPSANRVEKMKLKETEDMRAPLAFLLGKLDFSRDFNKYQVIPEEGAMKIVAYPKSDKLPYTQVEFTVGPDYRIKHLVVSGADTLEFQFEGEKLNPALSPNLFRFEAPQGAEFVDASGGSGRN
jgi:outer membrane lipoprotein carrier protein